MHKIKPCHVVQPRPYSGVEGHEHRIVFVFFFFTQQHRTAEFTRKAPRIQSAKLGFPSNSNNAQPGDVGTAKGTGEGQRQ